MKATMKTHFLKAACLVSAAMLMTSQANAADLTINSVSESMSLVDSQNGVNLSFTSTNLAGTTLLDQFGPNNQMLKSSFSGLSGMLDTRFDFSIPVVVGGNSETLFKATSTVLFTANQNHYLTSVSGGSGNSGVSGSKNDVETFSAQTDVFLVSKLFDVTSNELIRRVRTIAGNPMTTIDGVDPGPNVEPKETLIKATLPGFSVPKVTFAKFASS